MTEFLHRIGLPTAWHVATIAFSAMIALAALDFLGAIVAREWSLARHPGWLVLGFACFGALFIVYGLSLSYAELSVVTFGWVVFLQVGIVLYERVRLGVHLPADKWAAVVLILLLQAYLILRPSSSPASASHPDDAPLVGSAPAALVVER